MSHILMQPASILCGAELRKHLVSVVRLRGNGVRLRHNCQLGRSRTDPHGPWNRTRNGLMNGVVGTIHNQSVFQSAFECITSCVAACIRSPEAPQSAHTAAQRQSSRRDAVVVHGPASNCIDHRLHAITHETTALPSPRQHALVFWCVARTTHTLPPPAAHNYSRHNDSPASALLPSPECRCALSDARAWWAAPITACGAPVESVWRYRGWFRDPLAASPVRSS